MEDNCAMEESLDLALIGGDAVAVGKARVPLQRRLTNSFRYLREERHVKKNHSEVSTRLQQLRSQLEQDEATYQDNLSILANHKDIVGQQEATIATASKDHAMLQPKLVAAEAAAVTASAALYDAKAKRDKELEPHNERFDRISERIDEVERDIRDIEYEIRELRSDYTNATEAKQRSLDSRIDAKYRKIDSKRERIKKLEEDLSEVNAKISEIKGKHQVDISVKTAAVTAAGATVAKLSADMAKKEEVIKEARARIDRCNYVVAHPEETPALKTKLDRDKETIARLEQEVRDLEEHLRTLAEGSKMAKRFIVVCCGLLGAILLAVTFVCSGKPSKTIETASPTFPSSSHSQKHDGSSSQPTSSSSASASKDEDEMGGAEGALEAVAQGDKAAVPSSHTIETRYYSAKVPDATGEWTYDCANSYPTDAWDGESDCGYITSVYRNDVPVYEIACFGGIATPEGDVASAFIGTLDIPGTGELSVFAVVPIDREGPNADVAVSNAADEANYYAENVVLNPDYMATAPGTEDPTSADEYILPASDSEYYTRDQLENLSDWELCVARNEVFARYGRQFKNTDLADYFSSQPWYNGEYSPEDFDGWFSPNEYEKANTDLILEIEHERNSPYLS